MPTPDPIDEARATELARAAVELAGGAVSVYRNPRQPFSPHSRKVFDVEGVPVEVRWGEISSPAVVVSNNLFGEGHLPYADRMDAGVLGFYVVNSFRTLHLFRVAGGLLNSYWAANPHVDVQSGRHLEIRSL